MFQTGAFPAEIHSVGHVSRDTEHGDIQSYEMAEGCAEIRGVLTVTATEVCRADWEAVFLGLSECRGVSTVCDVLLYESEDVSRFVRVGLALHFALHRFRECHHERVVYRTVMREVVRRCGCVVRETVPIGRTRI